MTGPDWDEWDEEEYAECLAGERRRFAWVMRRYGGLTPAQAESAAVKRYPYQARGVPFRGLIFHHQAWTWAMREIYGHFYGREHPDLVLPSAEYWALN